MSESSSALRWQQWRGLSAWNLYFLAKFGLLWAGYLNFHPLANLVFMAALLLPLPSAKLHRWRNLLAIPVGFALFWHDTWLPGPQSIISQGSQLAAFSWDYLLDLVNRFINWNMVGAFFVLVVGWLFLAQWLRITVISLAVLLWITLRPYVAPWLTLWQHGRTAQSAPAAVERGAANATATGTAQNRTARRAAATGDIPPQNAAPTSENLTQWLKTFYASEAQRAVAFPASLPADAQPFEILVISICSLAWSDLQAVGLTAHPLWSHLDIQLKNYNSATSYSGPAVIRLLRASCGQPAHQGLYEPTEAKCYLFENLAKLGFKSQLMLDHNGVFGNFLQEIRQDGNIQAPLMDQAGLPVNLRAFDNSPIYDDAAVLQRWLQNENQQAGGRTATLFNLLPLHDGNHLPGTTKTADYKARAQKLFDELDAFLTQLENSHRKVMVIIVPEHGAALKGDRMQISGLRDIPSPSITHVPVGIKFTGMKAPHQGAPLAVDTPTSLLAVADLIARAVDGKLFVSDQVDWQALTDHLPPSAVVSENANAVVVDYQGKPYVRLNGGGWVPYPQ